MASLYANLKELHSLSLPNQSNVYSLAILEEIEQNGGDASDAALSELTNNRAKIVLAALRKPVHLFSFAHRENDRNQPFPTDKEIPFTYIPHQAEIIAINGFYRPTDDGAQSSLIIGIAIIKVGYRNIFGNKTLKLLLRINHDNYKGAVDYHHAPH